MHSYDVIVIGGGHAGAEAAALSARSGGTTLLITQQLEMIGQMSCNPAIGGIAKGTVAREVDALGGIMGRATDQACIQFRILNRSKGPAVWSPRAQCDRGLYRRAVRHLLERQPRLSFAQGTVAELLLIGGRVAGVVTREGERIEARAVVVTAGTFLRGRIHLGLDHSLAAGRAGESPSEELSQAIAGQGLTASRFKTGTPPRVDGRTVDLDRLTRQEGEGPSRFSFYERAESLPQLPCYLTWAGPEVREIVSRHLSESALYGGVISSRGPRYCPSIEDKVVKFPDAERHQIFLEPEGLETTEMYVNGLSTSLPAAVQLEMLRRIPGMESVQMTRPGYAIEYDYFPPTQLLPSLEVRGLKGLFFAGQINGTTGYEEAAGQGAIAGLNAAASALGLEMTVLARNQAMIGVLIDDLVTRGVDEPYRLFTSRAEYRLLLRQDNALRRLLPLAEERGLLTEAERRVAIGRLERENDLLARARGTRVDPSTANPLLARAASRPIEQPMRVAELVGRPRVRLSDLLGVDGESDDPESYHWAEIELKYAGYLHRESELALELAKLDRFLLPESLDYSEVPGVSFEAREKLGRQRPSSISQAGRIPGISPSDLQSLIYAVIRSRQATAPR
jgi:tRNA uridine 5-carboxymethylaminomethyl modification enzyme